MRISDWSSDVCSSDLPALSTACMLPSCRSCSVPESACGTICGAWRPTTRSRRKRQGAAPSTLPSNVSWPMTSGDHGLLHMVHDGFPVSVLRSEEHTSELQSLMRISYAVFCLKNKTHT